MLTGQFESFFSSLDQVAGKKWWVNTSMAPHHSADHIWSDAIFTTIKSAIFITINNLHNIWARKNAKVNQFWFWIELISSIVVHANWTLYINSNYDSIVLSFINQEGIFSIYFKHVRSDICIYIKVC